MIRYVRLLTVLAVLVLGGLAAVSCGGDDEDDGGGSPTATEGADDGTPSAGETPADTAEPTSEGEGSESGSFDDVPVPEGATQSDQGTFAADDIPFVDPGGNIDPGAYTNIEWRAYDVDIDSEAVIDFYVSELDDWDEVFKLDSGPGAFGIWSRNDQDEVLWVGTTDIGEGTELLLIHGTSD